MANESAAKQPAVQAVPPDTKPEQDELARLKAKWGDIFHMRIGGYGIVVRHFNEAEWDRFQGKAEKGDPRSLKDLLAACVVWSNVPFEDIISKRPAYGKKFGMGLIEWAGRGDELEKNEL